jgi:Fe2+ transport system protein B
MIGFCFWQMVVVTKMDLEAEPGAKMLSEEKLQTFTQKYGMPIAYTSAKEGKGVNDAIERIVELCLEDFKKMAAEARAETKPKRRTNCSVM